MGGGASSASYDEYGDGRRRQEFSCHRERKGGEEGPGGGGSRKERSGEWGVGSGDWEEYLIATAAKAGWAGGRAAFIDECQRTCSGWSWRRRRTRRARSGELCWWVERRGAGDGARASQDVSV